MRTTVTISDELLRAARDLARSRGETLGDVVDAALRRELHRPTESASAPLPVFRGTGGTLPGVDLSSNRAVQELLDEGVPLDKLR